jgi:ABC-type antimicrobial peptide transport system permease subunit
VLACGLVVTTSVFGASLASVVAHPSLYGWNWDVEVRSGYGGVSNIPGTKAAKVLRDDPDVAGFTGAYFASVQLDGLTVPVIGFDPGADPGPSMLSGREALHQNEIVLGATTLAELHKRVGDTLQLTSEGSAGVLLVIAGVAALPTAGLSTSQHVDLSVGAVIPTALVPADQQGLGEHDGPEAYFVRFRSGSSGAEQRLEQAMPQLTTDGDGTTDVIGVQRPAEIVDYRTVGAIPSAIGLVLSLGAAVALALALIASVRRRRRDLAVLRTLGFTTRQLLSVVMWQSIVVVVVGAVVGIPLGVIAGRTVWIRFADAIHVVPRPTVSLAMLSLVALGALVLAAGAGAVPAPQVAGTSTAVLLRAD